MGFVQLLFSPQGRLSLQGFWGLQLVILTTAVPLVWWGLQSDRLYVLYLLAVPMVWIEFCLIVKRWHDRGRSGWWGLVVLIPLVGLIWAVIETGFMSGTPGPNRYGRGGMNRNNFFPLHPHAAPDDLHAHFGDDDDLT